MANETVFLFGAGASKGAAHTLPCDPPLGCEVYERLAKCFPAEWGPDSPLGSKYGKGLCENFEKTMLEEVFMFEQDHISILEWQRKMALYFARFTTDSTGEDLYSGLLSFLKENKKISNSIFASLNYDCIFEQAACRLGLQVDYSCNEMEINEIKVLKVHGSCNFITENIQSQRYKLTSSALECGVDYLQPLDVEKALERKFSDSNASYYPVMSQYALNKYFVVAPAHIQKIRNTWSKFASGASLIAVIGVRPNPEDTHIWQPIQGTSAKLFYIGSEIDYKNWTSANKNFKFIGDKFDTGFEGLLRRLDGKF